MEMNELVLTGTIEGIFETETIGNFFEKRRFWLKHGEGKKAPVWELEAHQNDCQLLDKFSQGQKVRCNIEIKGVMREFRGRNTVFNTLVCKMIKIEA